MFDAGTTSLLLLRCEEHFARAQRLDADTHERARDGGGLQDLVEVGFERFWIARPALQAAGDDGRGRQSDREREPSSLDAGQFLGDARAPCRTRPCSR